MQCLWRTSLTSYVLSLSLLAGLSYTKFSLASLSIEPANVSASGGVVTIRAALQNVGPVAGAEVVQLYIGDTLASVVPYQKQMYGFSKEFLSSGQTQEVSFAVDPRELAFYLTRSSGGNKDAKWVVEAGQFDVYLGTDCLISSPQNCLQGSFWVTDTQYFLEV